MPTIRGSSPQTAALPARLLAWYDRHARALPWRVPPGVTLRPDPYRVWLSEVMLQQTTVPAVIGYFATFTTRWPTVQALAAAPLDDVLAAWAGLGYYARARNLHKCAQAVASLGGFPDTEDALLSLPGIGPYTAAAIAAIAFDRPAPVMDGNVERVMARLFAETEPLPGVKPSLRAHVARLTPQHRPGDYAQAVMDLGATICTPRRPACALCPWTDACQARAQGIAGDLPAKTPKAAKPLRQGTVWVALDRAGRVLTLRRPDRGLLGGMLALPTTDWADTAAHQPGAAPDPTPPVRATWARVGQVRHTFTHFHLILEVHLARVAALPASAPPATRAVDDMPTVFAKALRLALGSA